MSEDNDGASTADIHLAEQQEDDLRRVTNAKEIAASDDAMRHRQDSDGANVEGDDIEEEEDELDEDDISLDEETEEEEEEEEDGEEGSDGKDDTEHSDCGKELDQLERDHDQSEQDVEQDVRLEEDAATSNHEVEFFHGSGDSASPATGIVRFPNSPLITQADWQAPARNVKQKPRQVAVVDSRPTSVRDDWSELATHALRKRWGEKYVELNKGSLKQEDWKEVAAAVEELSNVHKTDVQCKNRLDTLKKKVKLERQKHSAIVSVDSRWPFYKQLDSLLSAPVKSTSVPGAVDAGKVVEGRFERSRKSDKKNAKSSPDDDSTTSRFKGSPDMTVCSSHHDVVGADAVQSRGKKRKIEDAASLRSLAKAITKVGEVYEKVESAKRWQLMDLEKIRMDFARDLEMRRIQLVMQTQVEIANLRHGTVDQDSAVSNLSGWWRNCIWPVIF